MKCQIVGKNIEITQAMTREIEKKLSKMDKYFVINDDVTARVLVSAHHLEQKIEVTIVTKMMDFRVEVRDPDVYNALDVAIDRLEGQMRKLKTKLDRRHKESLGESIAFENIKNEQDDSNDEMVRVKEVFLEPMDMEEAITRMEALGHAFYLYHDSEDDKVSVLYKRFDGGYGVIQAVNK